MEFPRLALNIQRALALLMLAAALGAASVERRSPLANRLRDSKPWLFWLATHAPDGPSAPSFHLGVYDPVRRSLALMRIPSSTRIQDKLTVSRVYANALKAGSDELAAARAVEDLTQIRLAELLPEPIDWSGAGRLTLDIPADESDDEPGLTAIRALKIRARTARTLWRLARPAAKVLLGGDITQADPLLLTLELRRTALEDLQPSVLPDDAAAPAFLSRLLFNRPPPATPEKAVVAEVLNGTDIQGLAAQASKVLRSSGVDVIALGQAPHPRTRTVVYDRTGDFERAARVRSALGCPTAIAATRIDALRGVDASVELGGDCTF